MLEENKYTTNTEVTVNYTENVGTDLENTGNVINQLRLEVNGQTDNSKQYNYDCKHQPYKYHHIHKIPPVYSILVLPSTGLLPV